MFNSAAPTPKDGPDIEPIQHRFAAAGRGQSLSAARAQAIPKLIVDGRLPVLPQATNGAQFVLTFALKEAKLRTQTGLPWNFHKDLKESFLEQLGIRPCAVGLTRLLRFYLASTERARSGAVFEEETYEKTH